MSGSRPLGENSALVVRSRHMRSVLSPNEQLTTAISAFENELKGTNQTAFRQYQVLRTDKVPDLEGVRRFTDGIYSACVQTHGGWRSHATRIMPFLTRIRDFASIGDVVVGGAQDLLVSGVWAAVRLAIEVHHRPKRFAVSREAWH